MKPPLALALDLVDAWLGSMQVHRFHVDRVHRAVRMSPNGGLVCCLWHQSLLGLAGAHRGLKVAALASRSKDGDLIAAALARLKLRAVRGSSARGAVPAARELMQAVDEGWMLAIAIDGPKGPFKQPKSGPLEMARRHGVPLIPVGVRATREFSFRRSWDQFRVPLPRAHLAVVYGEPLLFPPEEPAADELERRRRLIARQMHDLEAEAARRCGRPDVSPPPRHLAWLDAP